MSSPYDQLLGILDLDGVGGDTFVGPLCTAPFGFVFGGHVVAQAIVAASRTVPGDRQAHSLHLYFIRRGDAGEPITYVVSRVRDGGAFSTRHVDVQQDGQTIAEVLLSFHVEMPGLEHQSAAPAPVAPDTLLSVGEQFARLFVGELGEFGGFDIRWGGQRQDGSAQALSYARLDGPAPGDPVLARALLGYVSDAIFLSSVLVPHGLVPWDTEVRVSSLDRAIWFHTTPDLSDWVTYEHRSPQAGGSRGLAFGGLYAADGTLLASTAQEGFIRRVE